MSLYLALNTKPQIISWYSWDWHDLLSYNWRAGEGKYLELCCSCWWVALRVAFNAAHNIYKNQSYNSYNCKNNEFLRVKTI